MLFYGCVNSYKIDLLTGPNDRKIAFNNVDTFRQRPIAVSAPWQLYGATKYEFATILLGEARTVHFVYLHTSEG